MNKFQYLKFKRMNKFIKSECGLNKYEELSSYKSVLGRVRFYWFVLIASIRDRVNLWVIFKY